MTVLAREQRQRALAGEAVENFAGDGKALEAFLLGQKFRRVGDEGATRAPRGVLDVQHFVEENLLDHEFRNAATVHASVQDDLVRARIVRTELAAPTPRAPADVRAPQLA